MPLDVRFEAAGKPYRLCFSANALCALEEATGAGVDALGATLQDEKGKRLSLVRSVLWASPRASGWLCRETLRRWRPLANATHRVVCGWV
jgi:hypothetical protein